MSRFIDKIVDQLFTIIARKNKANSKLAAFLDKGNNGILVLSILILIPFLIVSTFFYRSLDNKLWSLLPIAIFVVIVTTVAALIRMNQRLSAGLPKPKEDILGFNLNLNIEEYRNLFAYLIKYEYVNEELTSYQEFYNVMTLNFREHDSKIYFDMNLAQLKYLLEHIKKLKKGITLKTFERSNKIYNKEKLVTQRALTSAYSYNIPDKEFRDHIDDFFKFLTDI